MISQVNLHAVANKKGWEKGKGRRNSKCFRKDQSFSPSGPYLFQQKVRQLSGPVSITPLRFGATKELTTM